jgi:hypothetical protein
MNSRSFNKNATLWKTDFKRKRVDDDSKCCLSCFNATTYEDSCLNFLFFLTVANGLATNVLKLRREKKFVLRYNCRLNETLYPNCRVGGLFGRFEGVCGEFRSLTNGTMRWNCGTGYTDTDSA